MEITGKVLTIGKLETVGEKQTEKKTITIEEIGKEYPNSITADVRGGKVSFLEGINVGDVITLQLNSKTREYNERMFNSISAWRITKEGNNDSDNESGDLLF